MFGTLKNGVVTPAPSCIVHNGRKFYNPTPGVLSAAGYLPIVFTEPPAPKEGVSYAPTYGIIDDKIVQKWTEVNSEQQLPSYDERVVLRIREVYSVDDELALLRQRDTKPDEFAQYNRIVEQIKDEERHRT